VRDVWGKQEKSGRLMEFIGSFGEVVGCMYVENKNSECFFESRKEIYWMKMCLMRFQRAASADFIYFTITPVSPSPSLQK